MAQELHQQPARVAARAAGEGERLFRRLHPRFHAHDIAHVLRELPDEIDQEVVGLLRRARDFVEIGLEERRQGDFF
jgi:hypothetical protein